MRIIVYRISIALDLFSIIVSYITFIFFFFFLMEDSDEGYECDGFVF